VQIVVLSILTLYASGIRARPNKGDSSFVNGLNSAILRYAGSPDVEPTTTQVPNSNPLREYDLHTRNHPGVPGGPAPGLADVVMTLPVSFVRPPSVELQFDFK
jgi:iron transport multicopper oxidase